MGLMSTSVKAAGRFVRRPIAPIVAGGILLEVALWLPYRHRPFVPPGTPFGDLIPLVPGWALLAAAATAMGAVFLAARRVVGQLRPTIGRWHGGKSVLVAAVAGFAGILAVSALLAVTQWRDSFPMWIVLGLLLGVLVAAGAVVLWVPWIWLTARERGKAPVAGAREPSDEDRYAVYGHAHHDLWWAKSQQWSVANWALLLIAGVAGVARAVTAESERHLATTFPYVVLMLVIALVAGRYFAKLHREIVHNRRVYRKLEIDTGIRQLRGKLPGQDLGDEHTDWWRGIENLWVMVAAIAVAAAFSIRLLDDSWAAAAPIGAGLFAIDAALVARGAWVSKGAG